LIIGRGAATPRSVVNFCIAITYGKAARGSPGTGAALGGEAAGFTPKTGG
jgi:hypothetical protein